MRLTALEVGSLARSKDVRKALRFGPNERPYSGRKMSGRKMRLAPQASARRYSTVYNSTKKTLLDLVGFTAQRRACIFDNDRFLDHFRSTAKTTWHYAVSVAMAPR